jgi:hypothetical protein
MDKRATWGSFLLGTDQIASAAANSTGMLMSYLIAASLLTGTTIGWGAAKLSSPGKQDKATVRKSYTNERLNADIGYVRERLKQEQAQQQKALAGDSPKAMRVFG